MNPFVLAFKNMVEVEDEEIRQDRRCYDLPSHNEVVVVFVGEDDAPPTSREIQYAVDAYVKIEGQRFAFTRNNQNKLRSKQYDALHEHVNNLENDHNVRPKRVFNFAINLSRCIRESCNTCSVIEFQKCGLPHVHILLHFATDDKLETAHDINNLISAEIPDPIVNPDLYDVVKTCMIHGPCGILNPNSSCMKNGVYSKNYPKEFNTNTVAVHNGYPRYRRRDNGLVINVKGNNVKGSRLCIYKGHDCANILINEQINHDEENTFSDCRYVSSPEALWRIFEYPISHMPHNIIRLKVHLLKNQLVYFRE
ncbi:uncharacterized protein LOC124811235 [Hydra vulgaris]|uniref:uncharacterized protein LOC124811235 n=1 Tax=Hydra vulgaris TaxID=6087 RepID=UPI001F5EF3A8|nr:uncharacterized protein LOC124811235 [Hydra vulgaris]